MSDDDTYLIDVDLGQHGGRLRLKDVEKLEAWARRERAAWEWITNPESINPPGDLQGHLNRFFSNFSALATRIRNGQTNGRQAEQEFITHYVSDTASYFHSQGNIGQSILSIRQEFGDEQAALAYALQVGLVNFNTRNPEHFKLLTYVAVPALLSGEARRRASRASYRAIVSDAQDLVAEQADQITRFEKDFSDLTQSQALRTQELFRRKLRLYVRARRKGFKRADQAIASINQVEKTYNEHMKLRSAVEYWSSKKTDHQSEEQSSKSSLLFFVKVSAAVITALFTALLLVMLEMSGVNSLPFVDLTPSGTDPLPATPFFIIMASAGTLITGFVWAAKILVRNYQTERHLKIDAEERRVMTLTYLALINEGAALPEEDRLVILNALFRRTSDLVPHDEPPQEVAMPALIARMIDKR